MVQRYMVSITAASYQTRSTTIPIKLTLYQRFFEAAKLDMASAMILTEKDLENSGKQLP
jgi:hypothetical protein